MNFYNSGSRINRKREDKEKKPPFFHRSERHLLWIIASYPVSYKGFNEGRKARWTVSFLVFILQVVERCTAGHEANNVRDSDEKKR